MWKVLIGAGILLFIACQQHSHTCYECGYTWQHGHWNNGNAIAHTCQQCGAIALMRGAPAWGYNYGVPYNWLRPA